MNKVAIWLSVLSWSVIKVILLRYLNLFLYPMVWSHQNPRTNACTVDLVNQPILRPVNFKGKSFEGDYYTQLEVNWTGKVKAAHLSACAIAPEPCRLSKNYIFYFFSVLEIKMDGQIPIPLCSETHWHIYS